MVGLVECPDGDEPHCRASLGIVAPDAHATRRTAGNVLALPARRRRHYHIGFAGKMSDPVGFVQGVNREGGTSLALTPTAVAGVNDEWRSAQSIPQLATGAAAFHDRAPV